MTLYIPTEYHFMKHGKEAQELENVINYNTINCEAGHTCHQMTAN